MTAAARIGRQRVQRLPDRFRDFGRFGPAGGGVIEIDRMTAIGQGV
jgi:hypothetical protein